jgi:DNA-binding SARP family transcriptional activator/TolB-like protein/tetratricopeptide (TPR) repeat protein
MFSLRLLGGAMLEGPDGPVRGRAVQRRRIALLAILAATRGRPMGREKLVGLLWPEHPGDAARHLLSESLYVLRKALGEGAFRSQGDEVALDPEMVGSDAREFEEAVESGSWERAHDLYHGPFLDGFFLSDTAEFERWVDGERDRLSALYGRVLERLAESAEEEREFLRAAAWWRRLSAHEPYSSRVVLRLMRALEHGGEHLAALRAANEHTEFLREDIGAAPDPAVTAYAERLRAAPGPSEVPAPPPPTEVPPPPPRAFSEHPRPAEAPEDGVSPHLSLDEAAAGALPKPGADREVHDQRGGRLRPAAVSLTAVAVAVIAFAVFNRGADGGDHELARSPSFPVQNVAVLYFEDNTAGGTLGYVASALTARLVDDLARVSALHVVSINGVKQFRRTDISADSIARVLRVGTLVSGSIHGSEKQLSVTVRLVDPATNVQIDSRTIRGSLDDLLAFEAQVGERAAEFLQPRIGREIRLQARTAGTNDVEARKLFLRGQEQWESARGVPGASDPLGTEVRRRRLATADSLLQAAARMDRRWSEPLVLRGWVALTQWEGADTVQALLALNRAMQYAGEALDRRPEDPAALELRGTVRWRMVHRGPLPDGADKSALARGAETDLRHALASDSTLARAWATLAQVLRVQEGQLAAADAAARRALQADAFVEEGPYVVDRLYRASLDLARFDTAAAWCDEGRRRYPNHWKFVECRLALMGYGVQAPPTVDGAWRLFRELGQLDPPRAARAGSRPYSPIYRRMLVAKVVARAGLADSARVLIRASRREAGSDPKLIASLTYDEAAVRLLLGETDAALALLEEYVRANPNQRELIANHVAFQSLRDHPRFRRLVDPPASRAAPNRPPLSGRRHAP